MGQARTSSKGFGPSTVLQGFAPDRIVTVTAGVPWAPPAGAVAFRVAATSGYYFDAVSGTPGALLAGMTTMIAQEIDTITFDTTMNIEVM